MTRVLIVDDHPVFRIGLRSLLSTVEIVDVVGEAATADEAVALAEQLDPDIILMDVRLHASDGVQACREIRSRRPETRVLMLTSFSDQEAIVASLLAGASGYLLKHADPAQLIEAIQTVAHGGSLLDQEVVSTLVNWIRQQESTVPGDPLLTLSTQERHILPLIAEGKTNRQIATQLGLSEHTVKTYISNILQKLQFTRRSELAAFIARLQQHSN